MHPFVLIHLWSSCCVKGAKGLPRGAFSGIWFQWHFCTVTNRVCVSVCFWLCVKRLWEDAVGSQRAGRHMSANSLLPAAVHELKPFFSSSSPKQLVSQLSFLMSLLLSFPLLSSCTQVHWFHTLSEQFLMCGCVIWICTMALLNI